MKVEVYTEVPAMKPHPSGGEMYDPSAQSTWALQDSVESETPSVISGFLLGLAEEFDPSGHSHNKPIVASISNTRIGIYKGETILTQIISKKNRVIAAMLRSAAEDISPKAPPTPVLR